PALYPHVVKLVQELALVCEKACLPWSYAELQAHVDNVITRTAENYSSMHQDQHFNRKSEIDYITGYVLKVANAYSI
ncbi:ketopantoate reductase family protein, partial [Colwellia marinimaniae]|uniref:ketopantoate reductase family protein n=1 Tax=Colwellia marinimaniae TaxID=1513592 RepID=UPI0027381020